MDFTTRLSRNKFRAKVRAWLEKNSAEIFGRKGEAMGASTASLLDVRDDGRWNKCTTTIAPCTRPATSHSTGPRNGAAAARACRAIDLPGRSVADRPAALRRQPARHRSHRPDHHAMGTEEQKKTSSRADAHRRRNLVSGLFRTRRGIRSCGPANARGARRRHVRRQRPEGVDQPGAALSNGRCCWCAPIPARPSTREFHTCCATCTAPGITVRPLVQITGDVRLQRSFL